MPSTLNNYSYIRQAIRLKALRTNRKENAGLLQHPRHADLHHTDIPEGSFIMTTMEYPV
jgi:hypothetical protein